MTTATESTPLPEYTMSADPDEPAAPPEQDPREIARRLVDSAKAKALAKKLAEDAKARIASAPPRPPAPPAPPPPPPAKKSMAERFARPVSTEDALRRAIEADKKAEAERATKPPSASQPAATAPVVTPAAAAASPAPRAAAAPAEVSPPARPHDPTEVALARLPGCEVISVNPVREPRVFNALWQSHRARAIGAGDITLLVAADALLDAVARLPSGNLVGLEIRWREGSWALFLDASRGAPVAVVPDPTIHLAGLS